MQTIESILQASVWPGGFHTLHTVTRAAGLEYLLEGQRPITLFAPDDGAFNHLPQRAISNLLKDVTQLRTLLSYHIVPLCLTRSLLSELASSSDGSQGSIELPTLSGHTLLATLTPTFQVQGIRVLEPELEADNGMIYPIEHVLRPPRLSEVSFDGQNPFTVRR